jgi:UDP-N-acetylmuramyl pentapeptide phosphotransferase/UDP-N-acetylglucosamine-1-phosphate transferase
LFHNLPRGRVFLGDSGAVVLGFFAAAVGLYGAVEDIWPILFPMLVFSPFLVDATLTLIKRMLGGQPYWMPHRLHIYQRLILTAGWTHTGVAVVYGVLMTLTATQGVWWIVQKKSAPDVLFWSGRGGNITVLLVWVLTYIALVLLAEWLIRKKQSR